MNGINSWQDWTRKKRLKAQTANIKNEKRDITTDHLLQRVSEDIAINLKISCNKFQEIQSIRSNTKIIGNIFLKLFKSWIHKLKPSHKGILGPEFYNLLVSSIKHLRRNDVKLT